MTPELARYLRPTERGVIIQKPTRDLAAYGLLVAFLLPIACCLLTLLVGLGAGVDQAGADAGAVLAGFMILATVLPFIGGLVLVVLSPIRSRRSAVEIDRVDATLRRADGTTTSLRGTHAIALVQPTAGLNWLAIALVIPTGPPIPVMANLHPLQRAKWERVAKELGQALGLPFEAVAQKPGSATRNTGTAVLCYLPFAGVFLIASLFNLKHSDPWIRFHARQSLLQGVVSIGLVLFLVAAGGAAIVLAPPEGFPFAVAALAGSVGLVQISRFVLRIYACVQAHRGRTWLIPWLARWSRRWHPESGPREF